MTPSPGSAGQPVTFTATVSGDDGGSGTVAFKAQSNTGVNTTLCDAAPVQNHTATCTTSSFGVGGYLVNAAYSGNRYSMPSTSASVSEVVYGPTTTTFSPQPPAVVNTSDNQTYTVVIGGANGSGKVRWNAQCESALTPYTGGDFVNDTSLSYVNGQWQSTCKSRTVGAGPNTITATFVPDSTSTPPLGGSSASASVTGALVRSGFWLFPDGSTTVPRRLAGVLQAEGGQRVDRERERQRHRFERVRCVLPVLDQPGRGLQPVEADLRAALLRQQRRLRRTRLRCLEARLHTVTVRRSLAAARPTTTPFS